MLNRRITFDVKNYKKELLSSPSFETNGVITFSPIRKGLKSKNACCIIEVDDEIINYYREQLNKFYGLKLIKPSWSAHVSIIQGSVDPESEAYKEVVKHYEGRKVSLKYQIFPRFNGDTSDAPNNHSDGKFWFLTVEAPIFKEIRDKLNLNSNFKPHLTIAKNK